jgi:pilus assembly protein CpaC
MGRQLIGILAAWIAFGWTAAAAAQAPAAAQDSDFPRIALAAGKSQVLIVNFEVRRIDVTNPMVAGANVVKTRASGPSEVLIDGKGSGVTSLILWGEDDRIQYEVAVDTPLLPLQAQIQAVFPGEDIHVTATDEAVVLSGRASTSEIAMRAEEIAQASSAKVKIINMLQRPGGIDTQQVMLEVRFAEVDHNALMELGASFLANRGNQQSGISTQQFATPFVDEAAPGQLGTGIAGIPPRTPLKDQVIQVPDFLNVFFFLRRDGLLAVVKALQQRGLFQSLAEPNLIAYNGQEASFLAGGEFPIPLVQGNTGQVTIQFKEFGVRLNFVPRINGDVIRLRVRPEVSTLDFANGLTLAGFTVPSLKTRRAETDVELRDGQSFAIAGLLDNQSFSNRQAIPWISSLPIVGNLFKSKSSTAIRTELLVLITPHLVRPLEPSEVPPLPVDPRSFIQPSSGIGGLLEGGGGLVDAPPPPSSTGEPRP